MDETDDAPRAPADEPLSWAARVRAASTTMRAPLGEEPAIDEPAVDEPAEQAREAEHRPRHYKRENARRVLFEWGAVVIGAVVVALLVKTFVVQAFYIPSASMEPTLREDDRVLVNKLSYDLHDINRGDVVVFERPPGQPAGDIEDLIKRVVGLPGEAVTITDGRVAIDGRVLDEPYLADGTTTTLERDIPGCEPPPGDAPGCLVPDDHVFVMGDNRSFSLDSRIFGPIADDLVIGRAFVRIWPVNHLGGL